MTTVTDDSALVRGAAEPRRGLRERLSGEGLDLRNTWQAIVGALLLPIGIAVIILGWQGAAHGRIDQQQIPYLISGGILGLALVIVGAFFFWAHWLYRMYDQAELHHLENLRLSAEQHQELLRALGDRGGAPASVAPAGAASSASYVATASGTNFHKPDCPIVSGRPGLRRITAAQARSMKPCRICEPG
ncbi:MAG TPA: hypothetical protein VHB69_14335 [Mycobacteriales bacterium]|nr:hypothetical protein [Mycobacteriales bacterium]